MYLNTFIAWSKEIWWLIDEYLKNELHSYSLPVKSNRPKQFVLHAIAILVVYCPMICTKYSTRPDEHAHAT